MPRLFAFQTLDGILDKLEFFRLNTGLVMLAPLLQRKLMELGDGVKLEHNCQTMSRAFALSYEELAVVDGHFGMPHIPKHGDLVPWEHSWLTTPLAPGWVIEPVPFNGFFSPSAVYTLRTPWLGLYRECNLDSSRLLEEDPVAQETIGVTAELISAIRKESGY